MRSGGRILHRVQAGAFWPLLVPAVMLFFQLTSGCSPSRSGKTVRSSSLPAARLSDGAYQPDFGMIGAPATKGTVSIKSKTLTYSNIGMVRFADSWSSREFLVDLGSYSQADDFGGPLGSMTLTAETLNYPLSGGAFPVLTEFYVVNDSGTTEFVKLTSGCRSSGMWRCSGGSCGANPECAIAAGSSFSSRQDWDQHQVPPFGYVTTNLFPRCDSDVGSWKCPTRGGLPSGHYYAKYLLLSNSGVSVSDRLADIEVKVTVKRDTADRSPASLPGGVNLNLVLVGDKNIEDSRTELGARNLNLMFAELNRIFTEESGARIKLNEIRVYEWSNANGGDQYSQVDANLLGNLFESGSKGVREADAESGITIFLVSDISYTGGNFTILGLSGGILGPPRSGTQSSGLAFSSFDRLALFNRSSSCQLKDCPRIRQESEFLEMSGTIAHEIGHYLGLNHPSEKPDSAGAQEHDSLSDTPVCLYRSLTPSTAVLDQRSCYVDETVQSAPLGEQSCKTACDASLGGSYLEATPSGAVLVDAEGVSGSDSLNGDMPVGFCPRVSQCQFNHVMWYTTKNRKMVSGSWQEDGNLFSGQSSAVLQWNPFVR